MKLLKKFSQKTKLLLLSLYFIKPIKKSNSGILYKIAVILSVYVPLYSNRLYSPTGDLFLKFRTETLLSFTNRSFRTNMSATASIMIDENAADSMLVFRDTTPLFETEITLLDLPFSVSPLFLYRPIRPKYFHKNFRPENYYGGKIDISFPYFSSLLYIASSGNTPDNRSVYNTNLLEKSLITDSLNTMYGASYILKLKPLKLSLSYLKHYHRESFPGGSKNIFKSSVIGKTVSTPSGETRNIHKFLSVAFAEPQSYENSQTNKRLYTVKHIEAMYDKNGPWKKIPIPFDRFESHYGRLMHFGDFTGTNAADPMKIAGGLPRKVRLVYRGNLKLLWKMTYVTNTIFASSNSALPGNIKPETMKLIPASISRNAVSGEEERLSVESLNDYKEVIIDTELIQNDFIGLNLFWKLKHHTFDIYAALQKKNDDFQTLYPSLLVKTVSEINSVTLKNRLIWIKRGFRPEMSGDHSVLPATARAQGHYPFFSDTLTHLKNHNEILNNFCNYYVTLPEENLFIHNDFNNNGIADFYGEVIKAGDTFLYNTGETGIPHAYAESSPTPHNFISAQGGFEFVTSFHLNRQKLHFLAESAYTASFEYTKSLHKLNDPPSSKKTLPLTPFNTDKKALSILLSGLYSHKIGGRWSLEHSAAIKTFLIPDTIVNHTFFLPDYEILKNNIMLSSLKTTARAGFDFIQLTLTSKNDFSISQFLNYYGTFQSLKAEHTFKIKDFFQITPGIKTYYNLRTYPLSSVENSFLYRDGFRNEVKLISIFKSIISYRPFKVYNSAEISFLRNGFNPYASNRPDIKNFFELLGIFRIEYKGKYHGVRYGISSTLLLKKKLYNFPAPSQDSYAGFSLNIYSGF